MKIIIAGYGVEGRSNYRYFRDLYPDAEIMIADEQAVSDAPEGAQVLAGEGVFGELHEADLVVRTAGLAPRLIKTDGKIWSATNEFFARCPAPIIGVTGTKGKGTTCSLIAAILRAAGKTVHLVGNIGVPALDVLPDVNPEDIVVYELSSFQLWDLKKSPHVAVVLMIEPDHLDVHASFEEYLEAKGNIALHQNPGDIIIYNEKNLYSTQIAQTSPAQKIGYPRPLESGEIDSLKLPGIHNQENASAAILAAKAILPEVSQAEICQGLADFTGLPHRLKFVAEKSGVKFYDDSISTTPGSAIAALKSFDNQKIIILGGSYKGADFAELAKEISTSNVKDTILIGEEAERIAAELKVQNFTHFTILNQVNMPEVVAVARGKASPGDVVILSPACASFGMFKNYQDRGEQFINAVEQLL